MSHFAQLDKNNIVIQVLVGDDSFTNEGYDWFVENFGGVWIKTSYNTRGGVHILGGTPLRKNYSEVGYSYDLTRDAFIAPKPYPSWLLDEATCRWQAPTPYPTDDKIYRWDEATTSWVEVIMV